MKLPLRYRIPVYLFAFFFPPFVVGVISTVSVLSETLFHKAPEALSPLVPKTQMSPALDPKLPNALILMGNEGTQVTELLIPYEILSASGKYNVRLVAPEIKLSSTTGGLALFPHLSFENAPKDLLIIPAVLKTDEKNLLNFVRTQFKSARHVVSLCEGARVLGDAGILSGRKLTTHFMALEDMRSYYPNTNFVGEERVVVDGKLISSAGVSAAADATLRALEIQQGKVFAANLKTELGSRHPAYDPILIP